VEPLSLASDPAASGTTEPAERAQSPGPRRSDSRIERRVPNARESLATLPDGEASDFDFEPHDTIPAPPWLEDEIATPHKP
jgi:hypothetical protein